MPHVTCPACRLTTYVVTPHAVRAQCPHCDAELLPLGGRDDRRAAADPDDPSRVSAA